MADAITGQWFVVSDDGIVRTTGRYRLGADGRQMLDLRQEMYGQDAFLDQIAKERSAVAGKKWGGGQSVGRVPLSAYFGSTGLAEAQKQGDHKYIRNFWNDPDHRKLRIFEGRL